MKQIVPNYYKNFKCIAGACKHNCCIGWEIDIDAETAALYKAVPGELGARLEQCISKEYPTHFILGAKDRCPFLNGENLCDIISTLGEGALCQVCADHPRFRNYFDDHIEIGLGLCCEAAGELILHMQEKMSLIGEEPQGDFFRFRKNVFDLLQDRCKPVEERLNSLFPITAKPAKWAAMYRSLERLDPAWGIYLDRLEKMDTLPPIPREWDLPLEQLVVYFIYRHLAGALEDGLLRERIAFAVLSTRIIHALAQTPENLAETARMYSAEIEYSDENIEAILKGITE